MLIVKREELQKLQEDLQEADKKSSRFSYQEFCAEHQKILRSLESDPKKLLKAYDVLRRGMLLQKKSEIRYVGQGSSRICFALAGGQCLKIAFNEKGVLQNRSEKKISKKFSGLSCFTQIFDSD